jgi:subtilase family protein
MSNRARLAVLGLVLLSIPVPAHAVGDLVVPLAWQGKLQHSPWDANNNQLDDALEGLPPAQMVDVIVDLVECLGSAAHTRLAAIGTITYIAEHFPIVLMSGVPASALVGLANDPAVAFVEEDWVAYHTLDVSNPAIQVRPSAAYPAPNTVYDKYPGVLGLNAGVAIVDGGIDDTAGPGVTHESITTFAAGLNCGLIGNCVDANPDDATGTGTHVAGIVLGVGEAAGPKVHVGIAPQAALYDVKVPTFAFALLQATYASRLARALDAIATKLTTNQWSVQTVLLPWSGCRNSDGTDALSVAVNNLSRMWALVVAPMGNCSACLTRGCTTCPCTMVPSPAAADSALAVGMVDDHGTISRLDDTLSDDSLRGPRLSDNDGDTTDENKPDLVAPGVNIESATWNTVNGYQNRSGTSAAAAHAAGCAALARSIAPGLQVDLKQLLVQTADPTEPSYTPNWGAGGLNCFAALDYLNDNNCSDLHFIGACGGGGQPPCGLHPGLHAQNMPVDGVWNSVTADIQNDGPGFSNPFQVEIRIGSFSNGDNSYNICTVDIPTMAPGATVHPQCQWQPRLEGANPGVVHACLHAAIKTPHDCPWGWANNEVQHNEEIARAYSPASVAMNVENPSTQPVTIELAGTFDCGGVSCSGWSFSPSANFFSMMPGDCATPVLLTVTPTSSSATREAHLYVTTLGHTTDGGTLDLGFVSVTARLACATRNLQWDPTGTSFTWLPAIGYIACTPIFDVARGLLPVTRYASTTLRGDFSSGVCLVKETSGGSWSDAENPPLGKGFYYVTRTGGPIPGSWDLNDAFQKGKVDDTLTVCN